MSFGRDIHNDAKLSAKPPLIRKSEKSVYGPRGDFTPGQMARKHTFDAQNVTFEQKDSNEDLLLKENFWRRPDRSQSFKANQVSDSGISDSINIRNSNNIMKNNGSSTIKQDEIDSAGLA